MNINIPSIQKLQNERNVKEQQKQNIFKVVLNKCVEKILYTNRHSDKTYIIFEVPKILIGFPSYDMKSCILFLIEKLTEHKYLVEFIDPFYLYIDWGSCKAGDGINKVPLKQKQESRSTFESKVLKEKIIKDEKNAEKLKSQTQKLLNKFPNTSKIVYVYADTPPKNKKGKK
jgi:hypothetical protein